MSTIASPNELASSSAVAAPRTFDAIYLAALVLVASVPLALGLYRLAMPSVWFDEAVTWLCTANGWTSFWLSAAAGEDCGGFVYTLIMKLWTSAFGFGEFSLRLPSVLFAAGMAVVLLQIGRDLGSLRAGVYMALVGALHPAVVCWSRQARAYSLEMFLTAIYLWIVLAYARDGRRRQAVGLAIVGALLSLTHIFGVFVVAGGTLFLLAMRFAPPAAETDDRVRRSLWPSILAVLLLGTWVFLLQGRVRQNLETFWIDGTMASRYLEVARTLVPFLVVGGLCTAAGLILLAFRRERPADRRLLWAVVFISACVWIGPAAASALSRGPHHFILARYFLPGVVPIVVVLGYFFASLPRLAAVPAAFALCGAALLVGNVQDFYFDAAHDEGRTRAAVQHVVRNFRKGDQIYVSPAHEWASLAYYGVPPQAVHGAGAFHERRPLAELLAAAPTSARKWVLVYNCEADDELRDLGLEECPQQRFGTIRLACVEPGDGLGSAN